MEWIVPEIHIRACVWLATKGPVAGLRCFGGLGNRIWLAS